MISKGSFGKVYEGYDLNDPNKNIICKINNYENMNENERDIIKKLNDANFKNFPVIHASGVRKGKAYLILERLGWTLEFY